MPAWLPRVQHALRLRMLSVRVLAVIEPTVFYLRRGVELVGIGKGWEWLSNKAAGPLWKNQGFCPEWRRRVGTRDGLRKVRRIDSLRYSLFVAGARDRGLDCSTSFLIVLSTAKDIWVDVQR